MNIDHDDGNRFSVNRVASKGRNPTNSIIKTALSILRSVFYTLALGTLAQVPQVFAATPAAGVSLQVYARLTITGAVGSNYVVQKVVEVVTNMTHNYWQTLTNLALSSSPYLWFDTNCPTTAGRCYRVVDPIVAANPNPALLVWIEPGTFTMGSPSSEKDRTSDEGPLTQVTISQGFWMSKYEVTQAEYLAVMGSNPSYFTGDLKRPAEEMTWIDATNYCGKLTQQERSAGRLPAGYVYRLPTEAEWEYACRAGTTTATAYGDSLSSAQANFDGNYPYNGAAVGPYLGRTTAVGSYTPNAWGLYDMHGNVWEWCLDWYGTYPGGSVTDPKGAVSGSYRVVRGGGWGGDGWLCRSAYRFHYWPDYRSNGIGFRPVLAPGQ